MGWGSQEGKGVRKPKVEGVKQNSSAVVAVLQYGHIRTANEKSPCAYI